MERDARRIIAAQALRAFAYGLTSVLLGASLEVRGWSTARVGTLLTAVVAGSALMSIVVARMGDRIGRRRLYGMLYVGLAITGVVYATSSSLVVLAAVALTGALSTEVVDSGPFTSLEQAMLASVSHAGGRARLFGTYNAVAAVVGSIGALAAGGPALLRDLVPNAWADQRFLAVLVPVGMLGALFARGLGQTVEAGRRLDPGPPLGASRPAVLRLAGLFAVDSFGGGFVVQSFIAFWFRRRFGISLEALGAIFFVSGLLQAVSFRVAAWLAERIGLLNVMVFTHLPSNVLLALIPLAPTAEVAVLLLLLRFSLSQMDVPTRQAYVVSLVEPSARTAAAAYTNTARFIARPAGPALAAASQSIAFGAPFVIAGLVKSLYDLALFAWFRRVPLGNR